MDTFNRLSIIFFCFSITFLLFIIILLRLFKRKLLRYPNQFYYYSLWAQLICGLHMLSLLIIIEFFEDTKDNQDLVETFFFISIFLYLIYFHYVFFLNAEIHRKLSQSLNKCSKKRVILYHASVLIISILITVIYYSIYQEEKKIASLKETNRFKISKIIFNVVIYYLAFLSFILCIFTFYLIRIKFWTNYKSLLSLVIASTFISVSTIAEAIVRTINLKDEDTKKYYTKSQILLLSLNGIFQGLSVLLNRGFRKTIRKLIEKWNTRNCNKCSINQNDKTEFETKEINISLTSGLFSDLFDNITKLVIDTKTLIKILVSTSLYYSSQPPDPNSKKTTFTSSHIEAYISNFNYPFSDKSKA